MPEDLHNCCKRCTGNKELLCKPPTHTMKALSVERVTANPGFFLIGFEHEANGCSGGKNRVSA